MTNEGFRRGDVFMAELRAEPGSVEHGRRPVVILQNNIGNLYAPTLIVAPITSRPRKHGCQVTQYPVPPTTFLRDGSIVLLEQITTMISANAGSISDHLMPGRWMPSAAASKSASGRMYRKGQKHIRFSPDDSGRTKIQEKASMQKEGGARIRTFAESGRDE